MRALHWKMAYRRKKSNLLTALLVAISTAFLIIYPSFIADAEAELENTYEQIEVSGWLINANGYEDPQIPYRTCQAILDTGFVKQYYAYSYVNFTLPDEALEKLRTEPGNESLSREKLMEKLSTRLKSITLGNPSILYGVSSADAESTLRRLQSSITWLEGYSATDFARDETICVLPETSGINLGEEAALILRHGLEEDEYRQIVRLKVVGLYSLNTANSLGGGALGYCPLETMRQMLSSDWGWGFAIRSFSFTLQNNRELPRFKEILVGLRLDRGSFVRAVIDDRILQGTVAPIEKNIALLRGVQNLLFALVTGMGFLLCFLFMRGRKIEFAVMRMLGENPLSLMLGALEEQAVLCVLGLGIGVLVAILLPGSTNATDWRIPALIAACYLAGAAVAALLGVHGQPMILLKGRE